MDFFRVFITAPISLTVLFLLAKLMGNKQMSELNMFDYINGITIGSIAAELATGEFADIYDGVMAMVIYSLIAIMLTFLSQKSLLLRRFITGKSIIIYDNGKFYNKNLSTAKIDINEILVMCRSKDILILMRYKPLSLKATVSFQFYRKTKIDRSLPMI